MVGLIIFPNDILIMAASIEELTLARESLIYLLQGLGFVINTKKFSFAALSKLRVCRGRNKFKGHDFSTSRGKEERISVSGAVEQCQFLLKNPLVAIRELSQLIGRTMQLQ